MNKKTISPSLVAGFATAVLLTIPGLKSFGCCLILPLAAAAAVYLEARFENFAHQITTKRALLIGVTTGLFAALFSTSFDVLISYLVRTNEIIEALPQLELMLSSFVSGEIKNETMNMLRKIEQEITSTGFSPLYTFFVLINNLIINSIFGLLGGLLGASYINKKFSGGNIK